MGGGFNVTQVRGRAENGGNPGSQGEQGCRESLSHTQNGVNWPSNKSVGAKMAPLTFLQESMGQNLTPKKLEK